MGEKDFQQFFFIKKYVEKKFICKIIFAKLLEIIHLALSSRNFLLKKVI